MAANYTTTPLETAPSAAVGATLTPNNTAWANSAWAEVLSAANNSDADGIVVAGIVFNPAALYDFELDIGKGAAGSETVVATIPGVIDSLGGGPCTVLFPIPIDNIPTNTRVSIRLRKHTTGTAGWTVSMLYYKKTLAGTVLTTAVAPLVVPSAAAQTSMTPSGTAWANITPVQVIASTAAAIVLAGISINPAAAEQWEIDIMTGGAGSEVVVTTMRGHVENSVSAGGIFFFPFMPPLDNIAASTRVSVRIRKSGTSTTAWTIKLMYYTKPI